MVNDYWSIVDVDAAGTGITTRYETMPELLNLQIRFQKFAERHRLLPAGSNILVAVSGGPDSIALLHLLVTLRPHRGFTLGVAHVNHLLRGDDAEGDEHFVRRLAQQHSVPCHVSRENVAIYAKHRSLGVEEAGRELRYRFFEQVRTQHGYDSVATAHTADDHAETVLFHCVRGSGVRGLGGIPVRRLEGHVVRPLLFATRQEIEEYVRAQGLEYRSDASNALTVYTRNYIRHRILPLIKEGINPDVVHTLLRSSELFRELDEYLANTAGTGLGLATVQNTGEEVRLSVTTLLTFPVLIRQYMLRKIAEECTGRSAGSGLIRNILACAEGQTGSWIPLPAGLAAWRDRDQLIIGRRQATESFSMTVEPGETFDVNGFHFSSEVVEAKGIGAFSGEESVAYVDADMVGSLLLTLRTWTPGDSFIPLGMKGSKKLSDFFVDEGVSRSEKQNYPVLETKGGEIIWVCGLRISDRFKIRPETRRALKLTYTKVPDTNYA